MNKNNTIEVKNKLDAVFEGISTVANVVPADQKHTFNFKGRKSSDIAGPVIKAITPKGGTVCDCFAGACSFGIAAGENGFNFFGTEYDNYTFSVDKALFTKCNENTIKNMFLQVKNDCQATVMDLYETECCGKKNYISKLHFDPEGPNGFDEPEYFSPTPHRDITNNESIILASACPICGSKRKIFENIDLDKIKATNKLDTSRFPRHHLIENSRINITSTHEADRYDRNFTNRAKYALLTIQDSILKLPESPERDVLEHALVASLTLARTSQYGSGSEYIYQVMRKQAQEKNVWELFADKVEAFIKFKKNYSILQSDNVLEDSNRLTLKNEDYRTFLDNYPCFFDTIYTDPPYTDQVPYFERSQLYRDWLHAFYDDNDSFILSNEMLDKEIIVSNAPSRSSTKSGLMQYYIDIDNMLKHFYNALKPNGNLVMTIKLGSNKYLSTLAEYIKLARKNGFEYVTKFGIDKKDPTLRKQAAYKNTMMNEMLIFFTKLDSDSKYWFAGDSNIEDEIIAYLYKEISSSEGILSLTACTAKIQQYLSKKHNIIPNSDNQARIVKIISDNFSIANDSLVYIDTNRLYLAEDDDADLFAKLYDIIPVIIKKFDTKDGFTLEDVYFEIINRLFEGNGSILDQIISAEDHESQIQNLLQNYCTMTDSQKYILKKYTESTLKDAVDVSSMDGYDFEDLTKKLLIAEGYYDVVQIGGAGDRGVDLMAKKKEDNVETGYIFQCKRWLGNVGGTPIQRLHSMREQMKPIISHAICVTTSNYTPDAIRESKSTGVGIINGSELMELLNKHFPGQYYHTILDSKQS